MKKTKKVIVFSTLFVLVDLLLVCGAVLGIMLYDYFSHRELFKMYLSEYGLPLILSLLFTLSTIICVVLFRVGYLVRTKKATMKAWLKGYDIDEFEGSGHKYTMGNSMYPQFSNTI